MMSLLPRIKVCGITRELDLRRAVRAGADAVGVVHHPPSPRHIAPDKARVLLAARPNEVLGVAVIVGASPADGERILRETGADAVQLCGNEQPGDWRGFGAPILRRIGVEDGAEEEIAAWLGVAAGFVLDHPSGPGGTGRVVDLDRARALCALAPCLLAGGLGPDDVAGRIAATHCAGVDASSRLEATPGIKDGARLAAFVAAARSALENLHSK